MTLINNEKFEELSLIPIKFSISKVETINIFIYLFFIFLFIQRQKMKKKKIYIYIYILWGPAQNNKLAGPWARPRTILSEETLRPIIPAQANWGEENTSEE